MILQADAALMYDAMSVLIEAFGKMLRKKPDLLNRSPSSSISSSSYSSNSNSNNGYLLNNRPNNGSKEIQHCGSGPDFKDPVVPFEVGEKIAKHIRKVRTITFIS